MNLRIGQGYDVHRLVSGLPLVLGGVKIPYKKGLLGHSDADVLLHSIIDALLGAVSLGDIGKYFPDTDPKFIGANSNDLLHEVNTLLQCDGWEIVNVDSTIIAQAPRLSLYIREIREKIAKILDIDMKKINVKAKTNEKLGYLGRGKAIESQAIVLLQFL